MSESNQENLLPLGLEGELVDATALGTFAGSIGAFEERDFYRINVDAGRWIRAEVDLDVSQDPLEYTILRIVDANGEVLDLAFLERTDDQVIIEAVAPETGAYFVEVNGGFSYRAHARGTGDYQVTLAELAPRTADLTVEVLSLEPRGDNANEVQISVRVTNSGAEDISDTALRIRLLDSFRADPDDPVLDEIGSISLAAGASTEIQSTVIMPLQTSSGFYLLQASVDPDDAIRETDENNNRAVSPAFEYTGGLPADLVPASQIELYRRDGSPVGNEVVRPGEELFARLVIANEGPGQSGDFLAQIATQFGVSGRIGLDHISVASIQPGSSASVEVLIVVPKADDFEPGTVTVSATLDSLGTVAETSKDNNAVTDRSFEVRFDGPQHRDETVIADLPGFSVLRGNADAADRYVLTDEEARDLIRDFEFGLDRIDVSGLGVESFDQIEISNQTRRDGSVNWVSISGPDGDAQVAVRFGDGTTLDASAFSADDFVYRWSTTDSSGFDDFIATEATELFVFQADGVRDLIRGFDLAVDTLDVSDFANGFDDLTITNQTRRDGSVTWVSVTGPDDKAEIGLRFAADQVLDAHELEARHFIFSDNAMPSLTQVDDLAGFTKLSGTGLDEQFNMLDDDVRDLLRGFDPGEDLLNVSAIADSFDELTITNQTRRDGSINWINVAGADGEIEFALRFAGDALFDAAELQEEHFIFG